MDIASVFDMDVDFHMNMDTELTLKIDLDIHILSQNDNDVDIDIDMSQHVQSMAFVQANRVLDAGHNEVQPLVSAAIIFLLQEMPNQGGFAPATLIMAAESAYHLLADCFQHNCVPSTMLAVWGPHLCRFALLVLHSAVL